MAVFFTVVMAIGWFLSYYYNDPGILYFAVLFSVFSNVGSYWFSDKIVLKLTRARLASETEFHDLHNIVENLAITAGLPIPKIYLVDDPSPNAFATGRNPEHAVVAITSGLLERLDRSELEGVISHELSHIGNYDMLLSTVVVVLAGFISLISDWFLRSMFWGGLNSDERKDNRTGMIFFAIGIALAVLSPIIAMLIQLAISRKREFLADASGALLTRYPQGLASALLKISKYERPMRTANNATAHLWISDPHAKKHSAVAKLFMTHPPIEERVKRLKEMVV